MLVSEIIQSSIPVLQYSDTVYTAIELMQDNSVKHLAVLDNEAYKGVISLDDLLDADETDTISTVADKLIHIQVFQNQHFLTALKLLAQANVTALPVLLASKEYVGVVTENILLQSLSVFLTADIPGGIFVVEMPPQQFSMGEICRLVETNDAYVTQVNSYMDHLSGLLTVTFKINKTEVSDILATLQRYEYNVKYYFGEEHFENSLKENYDNLMAYLNV